MTTAVLHRLTPRSYSNYSSIQTFNETGAVDYTGLLDDFEDAYSTLEQDAGYILSQNLQDRSVRSGLSLAGWKPGRNKAAQAVEFFEFDFEYAFPPVRDGWLPISPPLLIELRNKALKNLRLSILSVREKPRPGATS